jgi:hypothetical protein
MENPPPSATEPTNTPQANTEPPSSLPSDNTPQPSDINLDDFIGTADDLKAMFKDGKLNGRFANMGELLDTLKNIDDKHANTVREMKEAEKLQTTEVQQTQEQLLAQQTRMNTINEIVPQFLENGMQLTDEMMTKLTEVGLTESEIKLGAYEMKDTLDSHHKIMGGKEHYDIVMEFHAQNMTPEQKIAFNSDIQSGKHSEALILGLQTLYEKNVGQTQPDDTGDRFRGNPATDTVKGYESKAELFKDKKYIDSPAGKRDPAAVAKYRAKLAITNPKVYNG